jgi:hypothetical protein
MRRDAHVIDLRHGRQLAGFEDAADMAKVRSDDLDRLAVQQFAKAQRVNSRSPEASGTGVPRAIWAMTAAFSGRTASSTNQGKTVPAS